MTQFIKTNCENDIEPLHNDILFARYLHAIYNAKTSTVPNVNCLALAVMLLRGFKKTISLNI